jgi:hypothetical protein
MTPPVVSNRRPKPRPQRHVLGKLGHAVLATLATFAFTAGTFADSSMDSPTPVDVISSEDLASVPDTSVDDILKTMVSEGTFHLNIRGRLETVDQDGVDDAEAYTVRTRLGFTTGVYNSLQAHIDIEDVHAIDEHDYNNGLGNQPGTATIADPEGTELNQLYVDLKLDSGTLIRTGRQRVVLDDARFVGNVGWRQDEQTYDAVTVIHPFSDNLTAVYGYVWDIHRVFADEADLESDTHLINVAYTDDILGKITGFAYMLDVTDAQSLSSDTFGIRWEGSHDVKGDPEGPKVKYILSYANQTEGADNPTDYDADYFLADAKFVNNGWYVGGGWEQLGSDDGMAAFQTPLATGHKFNGWADVFLSTPSEGLEDTYIYAGGDICNGVKGKVTYHWYEADEGGGDLGEEINAVITKKLSDNMELLAKYADYDGDGSNADRTKFWLQLTLNY